MASNECMFCHEGLDVSDGGPESLAFMEHVESRPVCQDGFDAWTTNMATDWQG